MYNVSADQIMAVVHDILEAVKPVDGAKSIAHALDTLVQGEAEVDGCKHKEDLIAA